MPVNRCGWSRILSGQAGEAAGALNALGLCCSSKKNGNGTILDQFDTCCVSTCADAFGLIAEDLKKRLHARSVYVASNSDSTFEVHLQLSGTVSNEAVVTLTPTSGCNFPIGCSWTRSARSSSGMQSFQTIADLTTYVVRHLRK